MIKVLSAILMVIVFITGFAACVPQPTAVMEVTSSPTAMATTITASSTATPKPADSDLDVDIAKLEGLQIKFIHPWTGETLDLLHQMVDQFNQTNEWGIHVIMTAPGSAAMVTSRITEELANNIASNVLVAPVSQLLAIDEEHELVVDLSLYTASASYGMEASLMEDFNPIFWGEGLVNEKLVGIPAQRSALLMAYNSSWGKELGFNEVPGSIEEFREQVCAANASFRKDEDATNDGFGGWIINMDSASVHNWLLAFGADPLNDGEYSFSTPAAQKAFSYLYDLKVEACAWTNRSSTDAERFVQREALVYSLWMQDLGRQVDAMTRTDSKDQWLVMAHPGMEDGMLLTQGSSFAVLHQDAERDLAAWLFIRWLSQPAQQSRLLATQGTLPLSAAALAQMGDYGVEHPFWQQTVTKFTQYTTPPVDADWQVIAPVLEDAAWQLWMGGVSAEGLPDVLAQMDELVVELSERYP